MWVLGSCPWRVDPCPVAWALSKSGTSTGSSHSVNKDLFGYTTLTSDMFSGPAILCPQMLSLFHAELAQCLRIGIEGITNQKDTDPLKQQELIFARVQRYK